MTYSTIAIIYNPNSTGSSKALAEEFKKTLHARIPKQKVELRATEYAGHAEELAYTLAKSSAHPIVISSSGDGGYNEVINGALRAQNEGSHPTTGLLPAGNANDHFHNLHDADLIDLIVDNKPSHIDVLKVAYTSKGKKHTRYAHSYVGLGMTPIVGQELNKNKLNIFNQVWIVARALLSLKAVKLTIDHKTHHYDSVIFSNIDKMSKYMKVSQPSNVSDGEFEVTIFKRRNKLRLISLLLKASFVGLKEDDRVSKFTLHTVRETALQADGEIASLDGGTKVVITAEKQLLTCFV